jgi:protoporphyrinogen oxidase
MRVAIIGGGFMGLVLAYKISKNNASVKVFERNKQVGGLSTYHDFGPFIWDRFYHVILPTDTHLISLIEELGLGEKVNWKRTLTGYYVHNKFYSISSLKEFLLFPPLGILGKLMLGYTIFYGSRIKDWKKLEKISVKDWLIRVGGRQTYEKFWHPLLMAKLGENYKKVSAVFIWTYIKRLFEARGSSAQKEQMGYVSGGYKTVFDRLGKLLRKSKSDIILNTSVSSITPDPAGGLRLSHGGRE